MIRSDQGDGLGAKKNRLAFGLEKAQSRINYRYLGEVVDEAEESWRRYCRQDADNFSMTTSSHLHFVGARTQRPFEFSGGQRQRKNADFHEHEET